MKIIRPNLTNLVDTKQYPYAYTDQYGYFPSVNVGYGPYTSETEAKQKILSLFDNDINNIPDGLQATYYDTDETTIIFAIWYNNDLQPIRSSGGGSTVNVQSNYVIGSTNWNINIPVNAEGKCSNETLKTVSSTTITINNGGLEDFEIKIIIIQTAFCGVSYIYLCQIERKSSL